MEPRLGQDRLVRTLIARVQAEYRLGKTGRPLLEHAANAVVDTVAVAVAASDDPVLRNLLDWRAQYDGTASTAPGATVWVTGQAAPVATAALLNGVAAHALDYDDVSMSMSGHGSAVMVPALLALAERAGASGRELLQAYLISAYSAGVLAEGFDLTAHYAKGWHATVTLGTLGGVLGAGCLLNLTPAEATNAIGLAVSTVSGVRENFGSMTKSLHVGWASEAIVRACTLAKAGMTASESALDGQYGFYSLFRAEGDETELHAVQNALQAPLERYVFDLRIKQYPCCYHSHRAVDAALAARRRLGNQVSEIAGVTVRVNPGSIGSLIYGIPETPLQAKFSMQYAVASALLDGGVSLATFSEAALDHRERLALARAVTVVEDPTPTIGSTTYEEDYAIVEVRSEDGTTLTERCDTPLGHVTLSPIDEDRRLAKLSDCLSHAGWALTGDALLQRGHGLIDGELAPLVDAIAETPR